MLCRSGTPNGLRRKRASDGPRHALPTRITLRPASHHRPDEQAPPHVRCGARFAPHYLSLGSNRNEKCQNACQSPITPARRARAIAALLWHVHRLSVRGATIPPHFTPVLEDIFFSAGVVCCCVVIFVVRCAPSPRRSRRLLLVRTAVRPLRSTPCLCVSARRILLLFCPALCGSVCLRLAG
ncbi:hypothetical protein B0J12DRAFT_640762 [Macrophomina phaseolina]|uniref:Uncharacterized protein n=1 Tax=Macrophomina phaseolina TaxID=35725 RepID=A0ABQ8GWB4_9PEZI|nr:hypothetical protein B0J12DRAFT_640762 [Macrophomina phaseolina]